MHAPATRAAGALAGKRNGQSGTTLMELLVVMVILTIVGTMIIAGWWAGTQSMAFTTSSTEARDNGRTAIDRMTREIRDAQVPSTSYITSAGFPATTPAIVRARATYIALFTSFDVPGAMPIVSPRLVIYCLYPDGNLWRYADLNGDGINNGASSSSTWASSISTLTNGGGGPTTGVEQTASGWEGASLLTGNCVNGQVADPNAGTSSTDLFGYTSYTSTGTLQSQSAVRGDQNRSGIIGVQIHLLVDLNPNHTPMYTNLETSAQLRNAH